MLIFIRFALCFLIACMHAYLVHAQVVDIPLFGDEDDATEEVSQPKPVLKKVSTPSTNTSASKPIKLGNKNREKPNIGSNAEPITQLEMVPPPLPSLTIDLASKQQQPIQHKVPVNMRTQAIDIQGSPLWNVSVNENLYSSSRFSDVRGFELEGFYLGMTPEEVLALAQENNYKIISSKDTISKFRTAQYETFCKSRGIHVPEKIRACISKISRSNDTSYLSNLKIARPKTRDFIEFSFTSPATNNRLWRINYLNKGDNSLNFMAVNLQRKRDRQEAFLKALFNKYNTPDDPKNYIWGQENDAYMKAGMYGSNYDAFITLVDAELENDDLLEAKEWYEEAKPFEHFGFED